MKMSDTVVLPIIDNVISEELSPNALKVTWNLAAQSASIVRPYGRDLSKYDLKPYASGLDVIDCSSYDFVIPRCYDGTHPDPKYTVNRDAAKNAGKPWWPYSFYDFRYPAVPQANAVWNIIKDEQGNSSLMYDVEEWDYKNLLGVTVHVKFPPRANLLIGMQQLRDIYNGSSGKNPKFYMNPAAIHYLKPIPPWLLACEIHVADWRLNPLPDFEPWPKWTLWQYDGDPDLNLFNGTYAEFGAWLGQSPPSPAPTVEQRVAMLEQRVTILESECPKG
jgi:GH25 family lysozyme M1 (1,4-beta-N-acetylmuramidase)